MKARAIAFLLWLIFLIPHCLAPLLLLLRILFGSTQSAKDGLRSMDMTTNCLWFAGSPYESVSSHSWRELGHKGWAGRIVWFTDLLQPGHCASANKTEQPIVDFIDTQ